MGHKCPQTQSPVTKTFQDLCRFDQWMQGSNLHLGQSTDSSCFSSRVKREREREQTNSDKWPGRESKDTVPRTSYNYWKSHIFTAGKQSWEHIQLLLKSIKIKDFFFVLECKVTYSDLISCSLLVSETLYEC